MVLCTAREECRTKTKNGMLNEGVNQVKEFEKLFRGIECWYFFGYGFRLGIFDVWSLFYFTMAIGAIFVFWI